MSYDNDRDVVVVDRGGNGLGAIIGVIVILALLVGIWYFAFGPGQGTIGGTNQPNINVDVNLPTLAPNGS